ncbi:hypothetical protein TraAM80_09502, partial [Trypanosoma rangeli]
IGSDTAMVLGAEPQRPPTNPVQPPALATWKPLTLRRRALISPRDPGGVSRPQPTAVASAPAQGSFSNPTPETPPAPFLPPSTAPRRWEWTHCRLDRGEQYRSAETLTSRSRPLGWGGDPALA